MRDRGTNARQIVLSQVDVRRGQVFLQPCRRARAGDRRRVIAAGQTAMPAPGRAGVQDFRRDLLDLRHKRTVLVEIRLREPRVSPSLGVDILESPDRAGQETAAKWRISNETNTRCAGGFAGSSTLARYSDEYSVCTAAIG